MAVVWDYRDVTDVRAERSFAKLTDDHLIRLAALASRDDMKFRARFPEWAKNLLACCLVQGGARHFIYGDRGIKDLDIYLFYAVPDGRSASHFPWLRGGCTRNCDFGASELGRQRYTSNDWEDPHLKNKIPQWEPFQGRRVDIMSRAIPEDPRGSLTSVVNWIQRGRDSPDAGSTPWNISRAPVICLHPEMAKVLWVGPDRDDAGIEKGLYA